VDDFVLLVVRLEVRKVERSHRFQGRENRFVSARFWSRGAQFLSHLAQRAEHARPIESLAFTMFTIAHRRLFTFGFTVSWPHSPGLRRPASAVRQPQKAYRTRPNALFI
jgi:hypothetical protein